MKRSLAALGLLLTAFTTAQLPAQDADGPAKAGPYSSRDETAWADQARRVTIVRDDWGIPHVSGPTDADAVFGVVYAQAEDDFNRIETNYLNAMGRLAEAEGDAEIYRDLRMKLYIDPADLKAKYDASPAWLKRLMDSFAAGLNYYLATHPAVKPRVITRFEPWMALSFSEGSIGGDIERINLAQLRAFYDGQPAPRAALDEPSTYAEPTGSNGVAIAPANTRNKHALFLINPHTSFFFRAEAQMTSGDGLNAYGALTWGQFFIYQGFNEKAGWMHTSSGVDNIDEYAETVTMEGGRAFSLYDGKKQPLTTKTVAVPYKTATGMATRTFTVYYSNHGPVVRAADGKWISVRMMQDPVNALIQSYSRTKATNYKTFRATMERHTNSSNNTIFADAEGNIAYFHSNFIPRRDARFDWTRPVDGTSKATDWGRLLSVEESPHLLNPASGWLYNSNNWPWSAAGDSSPKRADFPAYVDRGTEESPRGLHALRVFDKKKDFTIESLLAAAYDSYLPFFANEIPGLLQAFDRLPDTDPLKAKLAPQIAILRAWDYRWSTESIATSLAVYWGEAVGRLAPLAALEAASNTLTADFGSWRTPWGDINRFQRVSGDIVQPFDDAKPSIPVGFTSARWGSLASFGATTANGTKKRYGTTGNSFVAVVEFGEKVKAKAVTAGGQSGSIESKHFNDQAERYSTGSLRDVYFYPADLQGHAERTYHPGDSR